MGGYRIDFNIIVGNRAGKRSLAMPRGMCEDKIKMDLKEVDVNLRNWGKLEYDWR